jgi:aryl-alcohol dehydrogenase-like predicted oxidoreductase
MEHKRLGKSGLKVSRLCLGCMQVWRARPGHPSLLECRVGASQFERLNGSFQEFAC